MPMMHLRLALRDTLRRPIFAATIILTLAIAIGSTIAAFAFIDAAFLTPLPVRDQDRLITLDAQNPRAGFVSAQWPVPWTALLQLGERRHAFAGLTGYVNVGPYPFAARDGDHVVHINRSSVAGNFFEVLGTRPQLGRLLRPEDDVLGAPDVVVLSDALWRHEFGADSTIVGRVIYFAREPHRVIGIAPPQFSFPAGTDAWAPVVPEFDNRFGIRVDSMTFYLVGRLAPGVTRQTARLEFEAVLRATVPTSAIYAYERGVGMPLPLTGSVTRFADVVLGADVRPGVIVVFAAVALVLVIACSNVAGLLLARGLSRASELSVRRALGASRRQIANLLLTESALLALTGGVLGLALAFGLLRAAIAFAPSGLPMIATAHIDPAVLAFAGAVTLLSALAFGLVPALRGANEAPQDVLRGSRTVTGSLVTQIARRTLVAAQVALALVVLSGAVLLGRTLNALQTTPLGFDPKHLLFFRPDILLPASKTDTAVYTQLDRMIESLGERTAEMPGLGPVTSSLFLPFSAGRPWIKYEVDGRPASGAQTHSQFALDDYFGVMHIPVLHGRALSRTDDAHAPLAVVVNDAFARQTWPGQDALGHRIHFDTDSASVWYTVVGIVGDDRFNDLSAPPPPTIYANPRQAGPRLPDDWYVIRTTGDPTHAERSLERTIESMGHAFGMSATVTGDSLLDARLARPRALAALFSSLAATALLLAAIGLFGVLSAYVRERRREIAVRSALGASPAQLRALVLTQTLAMGVAGLACGLPLALGGSHVLRAMVSDVRPPDLWTIGAIAVVLVAVVAGAAYLPMVRAARVDPRTALAAD
jgi:putative ABC transport system permease protein